MRTVADYQLRMLAITTNRDDRVGPVSHAAGRVWCDQYDRAALVSVIDRDDAGPIRFVLWCSLRGCGQCGESCLNAPNG